MTKELAHLARTRTPSVKESKAPETESRKNKVKITKLVDTGARGRSGVQDAHVRRFAFIRQTESIDELFRRRGEGAIRSFGRDNHRQFAR